MSRQHLVPRTTQHSFTFPNLHTTNTMEDVSMSCKPMDGDTPVAIIMRGLPGSGKSTLAKKLCAEHADHVYASADDYFMRGGRYQFSPRDLSKAHHACLKTFLLGVARRCPCVVVDNTNTQAWEYENYVTIAKIAGYKLRVVEILCISTEHAAMMNARNRHGVPLAASRAMYRRWQEDASAEVHEPVGLKPSPPTWSRHVASARRSDRPYGGYGSAESGAGVESGGGISAAAPTAGSARCAPPSGLAMARD